VLYDFVLPKENRLKKNAEFQSVYKKGDFFGTKLINFKYKKNGLPYTRVGFVVSTKISKSAVKRNGLKRMICEIFRLNLDKIKAEYDIVVITKPGITDLKHKDIEKDVMFFLKKTKLM